LNEVVLAGAPSEIGESQRDCRAGSGKMTKSDKVKLGIAAGGLALATVILVWYFFLSKPTVTPIEPLPEGTRAPNTGRATGQ
jgi:hypothetical protein